MQLVLAAVIRFCEGDAREEQELQLLKLGNVWLQRKRDGLSDDLLIFGINFPDSTSLRSLLKCYGLDDIEAHSLNISHDDHIGESIAPVIESWLLGEHRSAVPFLHWKSMLGTLAYPDLEWWWTGVKAEVASEMVPICDGIKTLLPRDFKDQAPTWLELLGQEKVKGLFDSEDANYDVCMDALGIARWLNAYDEVCENGYFDFEYMAASKVVPLDQMRLSKEVWQEYPDEISAAFEDENASASDLCAECLRVCLSNRAIDLAASLRRIFGDTASLMWALNTSIWPKLEQPMVEAANLLFNGDSLFLSELMPQWEFVNEGWGNLTEG